MDEELEMKDHYDFRGAQRGKFYRPLDQVKIPTYLDTEDKPDSSPTQSSSK